ncbi:hypothetical protein EON66_08020 [archaeon]|nr:MAG: hypothetical protein EON66_08020 [archaeon]
MCRKAPGYWRSLGEPKIIHYCSSPKPWDRVDEHGKPPARGELEMVWWQCFLEFQLAPPTAALPLTRAVPRLVSSVQEPREQALPAARDAQ